MQPLTQTMDLVFINDYLRGQGWVSKMGTFNLLGDTQMAHLILMYQKTVLVHPAKINEGLITSLNPIIPVSN